MERKKCYILYVGILLFQCFTSPIIYAVEVRSVETEGSIGFYGTYEPIGSPDPVPDIETKKIYPIDIASSSTAVSNRYKLPKTNTIEDNRRFFMGGLLLALTGLFWEKNRKRTMKNEIN